MTGYILRRVILRCGVACLALSLGWLTAACSAGDALDDVGAEIGVSEDPGAIGSGGAAGTAERADVSAPPALSDTSEWGRPTDPRPEDRAADAGGESRSDGIAEGPMIDIDEGEEEAPYPPCIDNSDCPSGWCLDGYDGTVCSEFCTEDCPEGWVCQGVQSPSRDMAWVCQPKWLGLCRPCRESAECPTKNSVCASYGDAGSFCATACLDDDDCPSGYGCADERCVLTEGECACDAAGSKAASSTDCWTENEVGTCMGERMCTDDGLTACSAGMASAEVCDGLDNDCDGIFDEETVGLPCELSNEHGVCEGLTTCDAATLGCEGQVPAPEICDGLDNDCDGEVDEDGTDLDVDGLPDCVDDDDDGDTYLDDADNCPEVPNPAQSDTDVDGLGDACDDDDDGDTIPDDEDNCPVNPNYEQLDEDGDGQGDVCDGDQDGDGIPDGEDNCPATANPDQDDLDGDGLGDACSDDKDGDGTPDGADTCPELSNPDQLDFDGDGQGNACDPDDDGDGDLDISDCAPLNAAMHHAAPEVCNGVDDNCNSAIDEEGAQGCDVYYLDGDGDGFGQTEQTKCLCQPAGTFSATKGDDCNDAAQTANPLAQEMCDGIDNDCDDVADEGGAVGCVNYFEDADFDGFGKQDTAECLCGPSGTHTTKQGGDCDDGNSAAYPGAQEVCGGGDEDCDLLTDEVGALGCQTYFKDGDGDGWGNADVKQCACGPSGVYVASFGGDCDDVDENTNPDKPEICDFKDNNCNNLTDEGQATGCTTYFVDSDGDGFAAPDAQSACLCAPNPPFVAQQQGDCGAFDSAIYPGAVEVCDGKDNNCNMQTDEGSADTDGDGSADCMDSDDDNDGTPDVADCQPTNSAIPSCNGKQCGEDGCGGSCGQCPAAGCTQPTAACMSQGRCQTVTNAEKSPDSLWTCTGCGDLDFEGQCWTDQVVVWCENGTLTSIDCSIQGGQCGWKPDNNWWDCIY
ncbi:MAG: MopE-related protein [Myxococcota bacterium]